jgi:hypothetical protein
MVARFCVLRSKVNSSRQRKSHAKSERTPADSRNEVRRKPASPQGSPGRIPSLGGNAVTISTVQCGKKGSQMYDRLAFQANLLRRLRKGARIRKATTSTTVSLALGRSQTEVSNLARSQQRARGGYHTVSDGKPEIAPTRIPRGARCRSATKRTRSFQRGPK